ncbi:hypothetical protein, partial [Nostoc sp.]|uniref:hypothetical protein n=1 Tax=Nostoc sp. TaxID=1180 RepID=UPI002FF841A5
SRRASKHHKYYCDTTSTNPLLINLIKVWDYLFDTLGTVAGSALFSFIPIPGATIVGGLVGGYVGSLAGHWVNDNWDTTLKPLTKPLEDGFMQSLLLPIVPLKLQNRKQQKPNKKPKN